MKNALIILFIILINNFSFCQGGHKIPTIEIGMGLNHMSGYDEIETKLGYGLYVKRIWFSEKNLNLISGALFESTKYFEDFVYCGHYCYFRDMKFSIYSLSIPIMLRAKVGNRFKGFIEAGPAFEIIPLKWGKGIEVIDSPFSSKSEKEISADFEHDNIDISANIGLGFIFPFKNLKISLSANYHSSLRNAIESQQSDLSKYLAIKTGIIIN